MASDRLVAQVSLVLWLPLYSHCTCCFGSAGMAERRSGNDIDVCEYLSQNPEVARWVETLKGYCETDKQWVARREFLLRNMESFPAVQPGVPSRSLDQLLSLSMVWANHVFLGCR